MIKITACYAKMVLPVLFASTYVRAVYQVIELTIKGVKSAVIDPTAYSCTIFSLGRHTAASLSNPKSISGYAVVTAALLCMCVMLLIIARISHFQKLER